MKILIIRFSSLGDVVLTTPLLSLIKEKYPDAQIYYLTKKNFSPILEGNHNIHRILLWEEVKKNKESSLYNEKFDYLLDLHNSTRSHFVKWKISYEKKAIYKKPYLKRILLVHWKKNTYKKIISVVWRYMRTLNALDIRPHYRKPQVYPDRPEAKRLTGWNMNKKSLAIAPGSKWFTKRWPEINFIDLITNFMEKYPDWQVILLGGPDERKDSKNIYKAVAKDKKKQGQIFNLVGDFSIRETAFFLKYSQIFLTNDSGLMHVASSFDVHIIALFLSTVPEFGFLPYTSNKTILSVDLPCKPCDHKGLSHCPKKHFQCAQRITPKIALEAIQSLIL